MNKPHIKRVLEKYIPGSNWLPAYKKSFSSRPEVALLGRIGQTTHFSDTVRHSDNIITPGVVILRIESSILYFNTEDILAKMHERIRSSGQNLKFLILDLSASPYVDVAGSKMLLNLAEELHKKGTRIRIVQALSGVRDILRKQGIEEITGHISRDKTIAEALSEFDIIAQDFDPRL